MKTKLPQPLRLLLLVTVLLLHSCDEDEKPKTIPVVTTSSVTEIMSTSAKSGGEITDSGNDGIIASGLVYSGTNTTPTITDSKTEDIPTDGIFTSTLAGLTSGTLYHARAYATNSIGTGYGEVVTFTTGNAAPTATKITITGTVQVLETLTAAYTYSDAEGDAESGTTIKWYIANDATGTGETAVEGATELTYALQPADEFKYIRVGITTRAATGATDGTEVKSSFVGPVAEEPTTVTFTYNGATVTYGIIISSVTGRRWLDRNLGAPAVATAQNDFANYGDSFQWGRGADGHQLVNRASTNAATAGVHGTTTTLATSSSPGDNLFILGGATAPYDWITPQNDNLWQGESGVNNPCPDGWRIPTIEEWQAENITDIANGFTQLKLTLGGIRRNTTGGFLSTTSTGRYWSSTITVISPGGAQNYGISSTSGTVYQDQRSQAMSCRCLRQ